MPIKIVCISDTHTYHNSLKLPEGDILVHSGDATFRGYEKEICDFGDWFRKQPFKYKIFVAGNHDTSFEDTPTQAREWFYDGHNLADVKPGDDGVYYLQDSAVEVDVNGQKVKIYGSPWQPEFCNWAFNLDTPEQLKAKWDLIPKGLDVLITHGPPYKLCDQVIRGKEHVGCRELRAAIQRTRPKLHVCGHIHEGYGVSRFGDTFIANASSCTAGYHPSNKPLVFLLHENGVMQNTQEVQGEETPIV